MNNGKKKNGNEKLYFIYVFIKLEKHGVEGAMEEGMPGQKRGERNAGTGESGKALPGLPKAL